MVSDGMRTAKHVGVFVAWPYANGDLHLGHVAGAYLPADIFARYHRMRGDRVLMVSGSDAHGTPITLKAKEEKAEPYDIVKRYHARFLQGWQRLGICFDLFTHTHTPNHIATVQAIFEKLEAQGDLTVATQQQFFDESEQMFLPDRYVHGTCPICDYDKARGDQCENCGKTFEAKELLEPKSRISNSTPVLRDTDHFFFQMQNYAEPLLDYIKEQEHWRPHVLNFTRAMIEDGLQQRAITRDIDWGIPVPKSGWESKVIYVWFDAVVGYLSASREWAQLRGQEGEWEQWWKGDDSKAFYFIGKDNIPFHSVIWPIELMAYDDSLKLPYDVPANQFLNIDGEKLSTSRGLAVWLLDVLDAIDADAIRYYIASILPETKDANFSWEEMVARNNGELVAAWGNLVNRVLGFAHGRYDGLVPQPGELDERDLELLKRIEDGFAVVANHYSKVHLRDALKEAFSLARDVNKYLDDKAPWTVFKTDKKSAGTSVYVAMRAIDSLKILLSPVLPETCQKIHEWFSYSSSLFGELEVSARDVEGDNYDVLRYLPTDDETNNIDRWKPSELAPGTPFAKPSPLFKILDVEMFESK
jgi:methionyl-tRNA synthetase